MAENYDVLIDLDAKIGEIKLDSAGVEETLLKSMAAFFRSMKVPEIDAPVDVRPFMRGMNKAAADAVVKEVQAKQQAILNAMDALDKQVEAKQAEIAAKRLKTKGPVGLAGRHFSVT